VCSLELSKCWPKLKRGFAAFVVVELEVELRVEWAKAGSLVEVGRKERLTALAAVAALASEVTLHTQSRSAAGPALLALHSRRSYLGFDRSNGLGPSGTLCCSLCCSRNDWRLPLMSALRFAGGGRGAETMLLPVVFLSVPLVVFWTLRTRPSVISHQPLCLGQRRQAPTAFRHWPLRELTDGATRVIGSRRVSR
jgi:hypothetical protein